MAIEIVENVHEVSSHELISCNEFLKFEKFSSEKTLELIDIESSGRVGNFSLANTG